MQDAFTSTNDPLFFLHHGGIDRMWAIWQELDLQKRLVDVAESPQSLTPRVPPFPGLENVPLNFMAPKPLTLDTPITLGFAAPDRRVGEVMDTLNRDGNGFLCYRYDRGASVYL
jgi:tyrosinase